MPNEMVIADKISLYRVFVDTGNNNGNNTGRDTVELNSYDNVRVFNEIQY